MSTVQKFLKILKSDLALSPSLINKPDWVLIFCYRGKNVVVLTRLSSPTMIVPDLQYVGDQIIDLIELLSTRKKDKLTYKLD